MSSNNQPATLNCPNCGAAVSSEDMQCLFCKSRLATVACPSCFGMIFSGHRHCPHCGTRVERSELEPDAVRRCPRCRTDMNVLALGSTKVRECSNCDGLWVDVAAFEEICRDKEQQSAALGGAATLPERLSRSPEKVRYDPCPECGRLMNRVNFARCSGVVVDICKGHGTWFDQHELQMIVEFIRGGGLDAAREKEKMKLEEERRRLKQEQLAATLRANQIFQQNSDSDYRLSVIVAARGLLKMLVD